VPKLVRDQSSVELGPASFIAKDFKEFIRIWGMTDVRASPSYSQSNGKTLAGCQKEIYAERDRPARSRLKLAGLSDRWRDEAQPLRCQVSRSLGSARWPARAVRCLFCAWGCLVLGGRGEVLQDPNLTRPLVAPGLVEGNPPAVRMRRNEAHAFH